MDEEYSQFDEDYEYYITPFRNYVNENKKETLDIITCEGPYDTIVEDTFDVLNTVLEDDNSVYTILSQKNYCY